MKTDFFNGFWLFSSNDSCVALWRIKLILSARPAPALVFDALVGLTALAYCVGPDTFCWTQTILSSIS